MSLEDDFSDVISKAMYGLGFSVSSLAAECQIAHERIQGVLNGHFDLGTLAALAVPLNLDAAALVRLHSYSPKKLELNGLSRIILPFGKWTVNAWIIDLGSTRLLFDTGYGAQDLSSHISTDSPTEAWITHDHADHIGGVDFLSKAGVRVHSVAEAARMGVYDLIDLSLRAVDLSGHCCPALGYFIDGLDKKIFVVGDALFAGSMGKWKSLETYHLAGKSLCAALHGQSLDLVILPGHGPATTLGEELVSNPFHNHFYKLQ